MLLPSDRSFPSRGTSAAVGALQLIPVPACSCALSVCQVLQLLWGRKFFCYHLGLTWSFFGVLSLQGVYHRGVFPRGMLTTHPQELFL